MNYKQAYQRLIEQGYSTREAEEIIDEELEFERISQRDREIEEEWDRKEKERNRNENI